MDSFFISETKVPSPKEQPTEVVERKGIGHPDSICDQVAEFASQALAKTYLAKVGRILHYNLDKGLLVAGKARIEWGGGKIKEPMKLVLGDRATFKADGKEIPVIETVRKAAREWFKSNLRFVRPEHLQIRPEIKKGSAELIRIFKRKDLLGANDTSALVGWWPLSNLEKLVLKLENFLNSSKFKKEFPESGEDIKVMGVRRNDCYSLTIAMPFIARFVDSEASYFRIKEKAKERIDEFLEKYGHKCKSWLNTLDKRGKGIGGTYLSLLGTSAESGDCGEVGRGNGVNGLIALNRPVSSEAAAGKNPVSHVGKIYNILSLQLAKEICKLENVEQAYVWLTSQIGKPINKPKLVSVQVALRKAGIKDVKPTIKSLISRRLRQIEDFCQELIQGKYPVC